MVSTDHGQHRTNAGPTLSQHWFCPGPTLGQHWANTGQHCANTGPTLDKHQRVLEPGTKCKGGGPRVVVSTAAFHARVRGSVSGLGVKVSIVGSLRDGEVPCSA